MTLLSTVVVGLCYAGAIIMIFLGKVMRSLIGVKHPGEM